MGLVFRASTVLFFAMAALCLAGCDGEGLGTIKHVVAGDQPGPGNGGGSPTVPPTSPGTPSTPTDRRFAGTWVTSFGDDFATDLAPRDAVEYAAQLNLTQNGATLNGSGRLWRMFRAGANASDNASGVSFNVSGSASGDDAVLTLSSSSTGVFSGQATWYLRLAGSRMVGLFHELRPNDGAFIRAGHATWHKASAPGSRDTWVSGFADSFTAAGISHQDRSAAVILTRGADGALGGTGSFVAETESEPIAFNFEVIDGRLNPPFADFTFGNLDLLGNDMVWMGLLSGDVLVGAFAQYDVSDRLIRTGHGTWYGTDTAADPSAVTRTWVTAFEDSVAAGGRRAPYLAALSLEAVEGGGVSGTGRIRNENRGTGFDSLTVVAGAVVGNQVQLELRGNGRTFSWDLRVTGNAMVGAYRQVDGAGNFVSRGVAEWRPASNVALPGTWTASWYDTNAVSDAIPQFAVAAITDLNAGRLAGSGALRFAGEATRRSFTLAGDVSGGDLSWTWQSPNLFGTYEWQLLRAGDRIFGVYTNTDSGGQVEARGFAVWHRGSRQ